MEIRQNLPFKHCEQCKEFVMDVEQQSVFGEDGLLTRTLFVGCRNEWMCKQLEDMIRKEQKEDGISTVQGL